MDAILFIVTIILHLSIVSSDDKYKILPSIYKMDDYNTCIERNDSYCKADVWLINHGYKNNPVWNLINDSINDKYSFNRNVIHRAICVPRNETVSLESIKKFSELRINKEINGTNLLALVNDVICTTRDIIQISLYDKLLLLFLATYISLIIYATIKDRQRQKCKTKYVENKIITSLSVTSNWKKVWNIEGNEDYNKLKSIQGIRFYNMLLIINGHTLISFTINYISNTNEVEKEFRTVLIQLILTMSPFLVQTFLLISSWILTLQIYNIYRDHGIFTVKHVFILIINRFFRIGVCSTVIILFMRSQVMGQLIRGPLIFDGVHIIHEACKHNWWQTFFFVNNYLYPADICNLASWYLSVDFHLYIIATITIYLILKFKLKEWKVISFLVILSIILYGSVIYVNGMGMAMRLNINIARKYIYSRSKDLAILYISTYSNWTTSLVGIFLGIIYTKNKNRNIVNRNFVTVLWLSLFFGLPSLVIFIVNHGLTWIPAAILGPLLKPLFSLGIGIGILGMSHNIGGLIKHVCENKYVVMLSNFSFSAYIFQVVVVFTKGVGTSSLIEFNQTKMIKYFLFFDAPVTMILAIICAVIIEQPGINLQKILLPQISRKKQK